MKRDLISLPLDLGSELIVDNFAGGGGASTGIERAFRVVRSTSRSTTMMKRSRCTQ